MGAFREITHRVDFCVVGGGLSGLCAAVAAARNGAQVCLMQDRPMLGGNASSEIRMWVSGAHGQHNRETGILEELMLENQYRNPDKNYSIWDSILFEKARFEPNITLLLNCSCMNAEMAQGKIAAIQGWQMTTQQVHRVEAALFADCSGDSVLAPLTGAAFRLGRESRGEYGEAIAPEHGDTKTMGMSCLIQAREERAESRFVPPYWAEKITKEQLKDRCPDLGQVTENFWYLELGGDRDSIGDTETLRDELLALAYGMWDYLKNDPEQAEKHRNWKLDWVGILPGKRESRRYVGAHVLTQPEVAGGGVFEDVVAYGGWTMDDHHPKGFRAKEPPNIFHPAPSPYGIPYRCLYSLSVPNLLFAGRNISVTHAAMSSTRVMGTCCLLGQAAGTAAALAAGAGCLPGEVDVGLLQRTLMDDDCFLPGLRREISALCGEAELFGEGENIEALRDGVDRSRPEGEHAWVAGIGDTASFGFGRGVRIRRVRLVFDSDLNRETGPALEARLKRGMFANRLLGQEPASPPETLVKGYRVVGILPEGGECVLVEERENHQRLRKHRVDAWVTGLRLEIRESWGRDRVRVFGFEAE